MKQQPLQLVEFIRLNFGTFLVGMLLVAIFYVVMFIVLPIRREQQIERRNRELGSVSGQAQPFVDIITVATFPTLTGAEACKLHLESEGLTVFLADAEMVRVDWFLSNAIGSVKIQVPSAEVETARTLLEKVRQRNEERSEPIGDNVCLACGVTMPQEGQRCEACGWSFADGDREVT